MVDTEHLLIMTAQPEFLSAAVAELKAFDQQLSALEELTPGTMLCRTSQVEDLMRTAARERPTFVRHLAPVQAQVPLTNQPQDLEEIAVALAQLPSLALLERGTRFSVQTRLVQTDKSLGERPYNGAQLSQALVELLTEETGAVEAVKKPQVVVSLLCTMTRAYLGISPTEENLSSWAGGARHYAQTPEQLSRAEFKFLEALEVFGLQLPSQGHALDLGAAPGGWTRLLLDAGLHTIAVDPARLDPRLAKRSELEHYRGHAQDYLKEALARGYRFDVIVNDMRMDARDAARLLVQAGSCLHPDGFVLSVFKLPHLTEHFNPLFTLREAVNILRDRYAVVQAHQLFHNRQEVTVVAAHPFPPKSTPKSHGGTARDETRRHPVSRTNAHRRSTR